MSGVITIFKNNKFLIEQPIITDARQFTLDFLNTIGETTHGVEARLYPRIKYLQFLQSSRSKDIEFHITHESIVLKQKVQEEAIVPVEIDWLNESNLEQFYSPEVIAKIMENREYAETCKCVSKLNIKGFPNEIPIVTRDSIKLEVKYEVLEKFVGERVNL
jgi:hypothetical protein